MTVAFTNGFGNGYILLHVENRCQKRVQKPLPSHMYRNGFKDRLLKCKKPLPF
jgi:hypothetical protein